MIVEIDLHHWFAPATRGNVTIAGLSVGEHIVKIRELDALGVCDKSKEDVLSSLSIPV